jgi:RNA polymerase sigma-70 factor (ECF subfamily)
MTEDLSQQVAAHREAIHRYVLGILHDPAASADVTQETLLRGHAKQADLEDASKLVPWLYRIATNLCRDRFRQDSRREQPLSLDQAGPNSPDSTLADTVEDDEPRLDKLMEQQEMSTCVQRYVAELTDTHRAVILLHDTEGLTNPEIAELLGVSLATVKIRLHRARKRLRAALDDACRFSTDERGVFVCDPKKETTES